MNGKLLLCHVPGCEKVAIIAEMSSALGSPAIVHYCVVHYEVLLNNDMDLRLDPNKIISDHMAMTVLSCYAQ